MNEPNTAPAPGEQVAQRPLTPVRQKRIYQVDGREKLLLILALGLGILMADLLFSLWKGLPGLGITLLVLTWEGTLLWYAGGGEVLQRLRKRGPEQGLTAAVLLLGLGFSLNSSMWLWCYNVLVLFPLLTVQMFQLFGPQRLPWDNPLMVPERAILLLDGLFTQLGAPFHTVAALKKERNRRMLYVLLGLCAVVPLFMLVVPLLLEADVVFNHMASGITQAMGEQFGPGLRRLVFGLLISPFLFGLFYYLRRGDALQVPRAKAKKDPTAWVVDPLLPLTVLLPLVVLYVLFVGVQSATLFGGSRYLEATGISYAEYARSGFFQLIWVSFINLAVVVAAVHFCRRGGRLWQVVRLLATGVVGLSGIMLLSAAWRMSLYVGTYGLSVKRVLTYWAMLMLVVFFVGALLKIWRQQFGFFRLLLVAGILGWLLLNALPVDMLVAKYNVNAYQTGNIQILDVSYLMGLSFDVLPILEELPGDMELYNAHGNTLETLVAAKRSVAAEEVGVWRTWTLSAWLASRGG